MAADLVIRVSVAATLLMMALVLSTAQVNGSPTVYGRLEDGARAVEPAPTSRSGRILGRRLAASAARGEQAPKEEEPLPTTPLGTVDSMVDQLHDFVKGTGSCAKWTTFGAERLKQGTVGLGGVTFSFLTSDPIVPQQKWCPQLIADSKAAGLTTGGEGNAFYFGAHAERTVVLFSFWMMAGARIPEGAMQRAIASLRPAADVCAKKVPLSKLDPDWPSCMGDQITRPDKAGNYGPVSFLVVMTEAVGNTIQSRNGFSGGPPFFKETLQVTGTGYTTRLTFIGVPKGVK